MKHYKNGSRIDIKNTYPHTASFYLPSDVVHHSFSFLFGNQREWSTRVKSLKFARSDSKENNKYIELKLHFYSNHMLKIIMLLPLYHLIMSLTTKFADIKNYSETRWKEEEEEEEEKIGAERVRYAPFRWRPEIDIAIYFLSSFFFVNYLHWTCNRILFDYFFARSWTTRKKKRNAKKLIKSCATQSSRQN